MDSLKPLHQRMKAVADALRLPLRRNSWRGLSGNFSGSGTGSSLDFQDHRAYMPGDDPRHINWNAYARTGHYTMKLYRQEVSPQVDLVLDVSASMFCDAAKTERVWELLYFAVESALQLGASLKCHALEAKRSIPIPIETLLGHRWEPGEHPTTGGLQMLKATPFRHGSLRVLVSDLLFPCDAVSLQPLVIAQGRGLVFSPFSDAESQPDWSGNLAFEDVETGLQKTQRVEPALLQRYCDAYRRHFDAWRDQCRRFNIGFARIPARNGFAEALRAEALTVGAVEL